MAIKNIKMSILKKKIMMNILITNYSWYDKFFSYIHMTVAVITPMLAFISQLGIGADTINTVILITSGIVPGMIKIKDHLKYDKIKDQAKQQSAKYQQLYQHIDREMSKTVKQNTNEFVSWINREFSIIETDDPELNSKLRAKYIQMCKEKNIPYDDDLQELTELLITNTDETKEQPHLETKEQEQAQPGISHYQISIAKNKDEFIKDYKKTLRSITPRADISWINERAMLE